MMHAQKTVFLHVQKLLSNGRLMQAKSNGEVSARLLEEMSSHKSGWTGRIIQSLSMAFSQPKQSISAAEYLEQTAAQLIAWASEIRVNAIRSPEPIEGSVVQVRLPDNYPIFEAIVKADARVYVPVMDKTYCISEILILPQQALPVLHPSQPSKNVKVSLKQHVDGLHERLYSFKS